jgi:hypothetical protein
MLSSDAKARLGGRPWRSGGTLASLQEKKEQRLLFMHRLYEVSDGSTLHDVNSAEVGKELGWSDQVTQNVVEYLADEGLLEFFSGGDLITITHTGVVEVETALDAPDRGTEHFPPAANVIVIGQMYGSQVQQGSITSQQHGSFNEPNRDQLRAVAELLRTILPDLGLDEDDRQEAEAELSTAKIQLGSNRPKWDIIKASFGRVAALVERVSSMATRSVELTQALDTLHKELPGV